ncbi:RHS repeat protein [Vibrio coralliilyticus]|uniref:RHS repeat protein n=1 Tax=Vibrio coralliilyticus TaxID=190893 RepID=UPI001560F50A|nr:RHS repeat protein [Vibrio coralliilyticus]NRF12891.1 RHS repeat protein [Vibrio coralliilyticus]
MTILSNATNFSEAVSSGVDPRTGEYSFSLILAELAFQATSGLGLTLSINYSASSSIDTGFGRGWALSLSHFNKATQTLALSTGQSFRIEWNATTKEYEMPYRRLKDVRVLFESKETNYKYDRLKVIHKDGRIEFLNYDEGVLDELVSPVGHSIYFDYRNSDTGKLLWRIRESSDGKTGLAVIIDTWSDKWQSVVIHKFNDFESYRVIFNCIGSGLQRRLQSVKLPGDQIYKFGYRYVTASGYDLIEEIIHASGLREKLRYLDAGHSLQSGAPIRSVPYITDHWLYPGEAQELRHTQYEYSDSNYLGFASDARWIAGEDTLFSARQDYQYSSTETVDGKVKIIRTYNKYHLLEKSEYYQDGTLYQVEDMVYFANLAWSIKHQPATYAFVKAQKVTYIDGNRKRTVETQYSYDDYGNQTQVVEGDGTKITRQFYPPTGEKGRCPPEPNQFRSLLKTESFYPATNLHGESPRHTHYSYQKLARLDSSYIVLLGKVTTDVEESKYSYYSDSNKLLEYGRLKEIKSMFNNHARYERFSYVFNQESVKTITTLDTHDGIRVSSSERVSLSTGQVLESIDHDGYTSKYAYDVARRPIRETIAEGTAYEATSRTQYQVGSGQNLITITDALGNRHRKKMNNAGNVITEEITDEKGQFKEVKKSTYNALGQLVKTIETDYIDGQPLPISTEFQYDKYGEVDKILYEDGRLETIKQDRVELSVVHNNDNLIETTTIFNNAGLEIKKETRDIADGKRLLSETSYSYDGYDNLVSTKDTGGHVTQHTYDKLDRLVSTIKFIDGVTVTEKYAYASFSTDELVTAIHVNEKVLGKRMYDGLGRILEDHAATASTLYQYKGEKMSPIGVVTPAGDSISYRNHDYFDVPVSRTVSSVSGLDSTYRYDSISGEMLNSLNVNSRHSRVVDRMGRVTSESLNQRDGVERQAHHSYSLLGRPITTEDFFSNRTSYNYDRYGRPSVLTNKTGSVSTVTTIGYDRHSRPIKYDVKGHKHNIVIDLELNSQGIETKRTVLVNGRLDFTLSQTFNTQLQLIKRVYTRAGAVTTETMEYDALHRLVKYHCTGQLLPGDGQGNRIRRQSFQYDILGNVTKTITLFSDGTSNEANYSYLASNPVQLEYITHTHSSYPSECSLNYDAAGNLLNDEQSRSFAYNALGQIESVKKGGQSLSDYYFDAEGKLVAQTLDGEQLHLFYQNGKLVNESASGINSAMQSMGGGVTGHTVSKASGPSTQTFLVANAQGSVIGELSGDIDDAKMKQRAYSPYGLES